MCFCSQPRISQLDSFCSLFTGSHNAFSLPLFLGY
ncbi:unnamed protein product [Tenebrio molitor]|nr:unnamed protein product [Tenebrio molitor]